MDLTNELLGNSKHILVSVGLSRAYRKQMTPRLNNICRLTTSTLSAAAILLSAWYWGLGVVELVKAPFLLQEVVELVKAPFDCRIFSKIHYSKTTANLSVCHRKQLRTTVLQLTDALDAIDDSNEKTH